MQLTHVLAAGAMSELVAAQAAPVRRGVDCAFGTSADSGATCESFASGWGLSVDKLKALNPGITCPDLDTSGFYCVIGTVTDDGNGGGDSKPTTTTTTTTTTTSTTSVQKPTTTLVTSTKTSSGDAPSPTMPGLADNCDKFHKVVSGDQCDTIAKQYSITQDQFKEWNSQINDGCTNLWLDYYVCVHIPGASTDPGSGGDDSGSDGGNDGPEPQMPGITSDCKDFHKVVSGDGCWKITNDAGISTEDFHKWNTEIDDQCTNLWLNYYVCIGV